MSALQLKSVFPKYTHKTLIIRKGELGEFSKIVEEYEELLDAHAQGIAGFELVELSDLLGAMLHYVWKKYRLLSPFLYALCFARGIYKGFKRTFFGGRARRDCYQRN